nr:LasK [uncultured Verrucomicrobiota bacterium]UWK15772.1 LasK [uncultured Verrucomicrobiota bacterium]
MSFSFLFFSEGGGGVSEAEKYALMREVTLFADREGFEAVYIPERHFSEFGSIYANSAVLAAYLIPQTERVRFRTAGVSLPLHHPAEVVEWWAMNDVLSGGRVDLGFGSGWSRSDFVFAPGSYAGRRELCSERIPLVQRLWRGEVVSFPGPGGESLPIRVYPRPVQGELKVWLLVASNDEAFRHAGRRGYNVFTMLYGFDLAALAKKIELYRAAWAAAGHDSGGGVVSLMLHTLVHEDSGRVAAAVEGPFRRYIRSSLRAHLQAGLGREGGVIEGEGQEKMVEYAYQRYFRTGAIFGGVGEGREVVERAREAGVDEIACLVDFGVDYGLVRESLPYLGELVSPYIG